MKPIYWDTEVLPRSAEARPCEMLFFVLPQGYAPQWTGTPKTAQDTNVLKSGFLPGSFVLTGYGLLQDGEALTIPYPIVECHYDQRQLFRISAPVNLAQRYWIEPDRKFIMRLVWPRGIRPKVLWDTKLKLTLWGDTFNTKGSAP